jgi:hypothetical protein
VLVTVFSSFSKPLSAAGLVIHVQNEANGGAPETSSVDGVAVEPSAELVDGVDECGPALARSERMAVTAAAGAALLRPFSISVLSAH